jgi:hypothetical protein
VAQRAARQRVGPQRGITDARHALPPSLTKGQAVRLPPLVGGAAQIHPAERGIHRRQSLGERRLGWVITQFLAVECRDAAAVRRQAAEDECGEHRHGHDWQDDATPLQPGPLEDHDGSSSPFGFFSRQGVHQSRAKVRRYLAKWLHGIEGQERVSS